MELDGYSTHNGESRPLAGENLTTEQKICKTPINTKAKIKLAGIVTMAIILVIGIMKKNDENQQSSYTGKAEADMLISTIPNN